MRILKLVIVSFIVLLFIITIISLFIPSTVAISKAVQIDAEKKLVMAQLSEPSNWKNWYPSQDAVAILHENGKATGILLDSTTRLEIVAVYDSGVTAVYTARDARNLTTSWKLVPAGNGTGVEWRMDFYLGWYPWKKFSSLLFEKRYGPVLEQGLSNLKTYLEHDHSSNN